MNPGEVSRLRVSKKFQSRIHDKKVFSEGFTVVTPLQRTVDGGITDPEEEVTRRGL